MLGGVIMSNSIEFPKNFQFYLQAAMELFHLGEIDKTIEHLLKALSIEMDDEIFNFCMSLLQEQNRHTEASDLLKRYKPYLFDSNRMEADDLLLLNVLIESDQLEEARKQIFQRNIEINQSDKNRHFYDMIEQNILIIEAKEESKRQQFIQDTSEESILIAQKSYYHQIDFIKKMKKLPEKNLLQISKNLLIETTIHPLFKTEILQLLIEKEMTDEITIQKSCYTKSFLVSNLHLMEESLFYLKIMEQMRLGTYSVDDKERLTTNLFLHMAYFYPFEQEAFPSTEVWIELVLEGNHSQGDEMEKIITNRSIQEVEGGLDILTDL